MSTFGLKSANLTSSTDIKGPILSSLLLTLPSDKGYIFSLIKILGRPDEKRTRVKNIIEDHLKRLEQTTTEDVNIPRRFEQILSAINEDIGRHIKDSDRIPYSDFHAVIGIINNDQVFVSGTGNLSAIFMHQTAKSRYVIYELDKQFVESEQGWEKPFITILDGELHPGDTFYVATKVATKDIDLNGLQDILITLPPSGALQRIQQHVSVGSAYGAVSFSVLSKEKVGPPKKVNPINSIEHLGKTKDDTASLLGEQSPDFGSLVNRLTKPLLASLSKPGTSGTKSMIRNLLRTVVKITASVAVLTGSLTKNLYRILIGTLKKIISKDNSDTIHSVSEPKIQKKSILRKIQNLSTSTKLITLGIIVIMIVLISSVSLLNSNTSIQEKESAFQTIISRVDEKKSSAEASLIYDDTDKARKFLAEAGALLETISPTNNSQENEIDEMRKSINSIFYQLRGVNETEVETIAETSGIRFVNTVEAGGIIYGFTAESDLYRLNELELSFQKVEVIKGSVGSAVHSTGEGTNLLFIDSNGRLGRADTTNNTINPITSGVEALTDISSLTIYNDVLYVISRATQQIVKMRAQGSGYEAGTAWISSRINDLSTAQDIAIDGDIYILTSSGISRFSSGKEVDFNLDKVDPVLESAIDFFTTIGTENIYILDSSEGRVLVYTKDGKFVTQFVNEEFKNGLMISVREDKKLILITTPTKTVSFPATNLLQ